MCFLTLNKSTISTLPSPLLSPVITISNVLVSPLELLISILSPLLKFVELVIVLPLESLYNSYVTNASWAAISSRFISLTDAQVQNVITYGRHDP